ncbi:hypothetical protein N8D56_15040 [Devosia sp. A8/3-2]|nr:hypothetical protein N8D56_15040 [Devosia sp. A8/3-2]
MLGGKASIAPAHQQPDLPDRLKAPAHRVAMDGMCRARLVGQEIVRRLLIFAASRYWLRQHVPPDDLDLLIILIIIGFK